MTNGNRKGRSGMGAEEFAAQLASDQEYQRQRAAFDKQLEEKAAVWRAAETPLVAELKAVGVDVDSVWDLVNTDRPYPSALPVLLRYLEDGDLPDRVLEGVGRSLAVKPAVEFWDRLVELVVSPSSDGQAEGSAVAVAACATAREVDDLIRIVTETERRPEHVYLLRPIWKHGGQRGRDLLASLASDAVLAAEAKALLEGDL
jgi:hypothetical protein